MVDHDNAPLWLYSNGETLSLLTADTPAPFDGYMPFRNGPERGGYNLLFSGGSARAIRATVLESDYDFARVWLEFEGISDLTRLDHQPIEIYGSLMDSSRCAIVARTDGDDEIYEIPVRIEMLKAPEATSASEVSNGARSSNVSCPNSDGRGPACQQSDAGAIALLRGLPNAGRLQ